MGAGVERVPAAGAKRLEEPWEAVELASLAYMPVESMALSIPKRGGLAGALAMLRESKQLDPRFAATTGWR